MEVTKMGKLSKDALDIVLKCEMTEQDKQSMSGTAPKQFIIQQPQKGQFVKGELQHTAGRKGFRIVGRIHSNSDLKSDVIGYVLYNDKKKDFCQYTVAQVKNILAAYEFVNAVLENEEIHITDCAADKLLQFDNMMNPIMPVQVVYVVERLSETIRANGQAKEQIVYSIINKNLQVASITETNLMIAVKSGKAAVSNLRVDNNYLAAKEVNSLPTYTREVNYLAPNENTQAAPENTQKKTKLKFENHARFLDNMVNFLDSCIVLMDQPNYNTTYIAFGSTNSIKRGLSLLGQSPEKLKTVLYEELLPLYCARHGKTQENIEGIEALMTKPTIVKATENTVMYSYVYNTAFEKDIRMKGSTAGEYLVKFIKLLGLIGVLKVVHVSDLLKLNYWGVKAEHPYIFYNYDTRDQAILCRQFKSDLLKEKNWPSARILTAALKRMPLADIKHLEEAGQLVACGIKRVKVMNASRRGHVRGIMIWPMPMNANNSNVSKLFKLLTDFFDNNTSYDVQLVKPFAYHLLSEYNYVASDAYDNNKAQAMINYTYKRVAAMSCILYDYLVHNAVHTDSLDSMFSTILSKIPNTKHTDPSSLCAVRTRIDMATDFNSIINKKLYSLFLRTGGLVVPLKPRGLAVNMLPTLLWEHMADYDCIKNNTNYISADATLAARLVNECALPRASGTKSNQFCQTVAGRLRLYMEAVYGSDEADYKIPGRKAPYTSYYQKIAATQLYLIRPYYPNKYMLGLAQKRFLVPTIGRIAKPTANSTHKVW